MEEQIKEKREEKFPVEDQIVEKQEGKFLVQVENQALKQKHAG